MPQNFMSISTSPSPSGRRCRRSGLTSQAALAQPMHSVSIGAAIASRCEHGCTVHGLGRAGRECKGPPRPHSRARSLVRP